MKNSNSSETRYEMRALAMGIAAIMLGLQIAAWAGFVQIIRDGHADFRSYYSAGYMVRTGHRTEIYDYGSEKTVQDATVSPETVAMLYIHPAFEALLFVPFSALPYRWAFCTFLLTNLCLLAFVYRMWRPRLTHLAAVWSALPAALLFCFLGTGETLMQGQDSILLLAIIAGVDALLNSGMALSAGALLGLGLFRFQFVLPIVLLFLLWGRWRVIAGFVSSAIALFAISVGVTGLAGTKAYVHTLIALSAGTEGHYHQPLWLMPSLRGLISGLFGSALTPGTIRTASLWAGIVVVILLAWNRPRSAQLQIAVTAAALLSYHLLVHDLTMLLLPIAFTLNEFIGTLEVNKFRERLCAWLAVAVFAAPAMLAYGTKRFYLAALLLAAFLAALVAVYRGRRSSVSTLEPSDA